MNNKFLAKYSKVILYGLIILLPVIMTILLTNLVLKTDIFHYHPFWTDEVDYWIQINSFKEVGFDSGFFTMNEITSNSTFSHYGTHGPLFPALFGILGRIFGWYLYSGPLFNLLLICLSISAFLLITRPGLKQSLFLLIILFLAYHLYLYIPTTMQESLNCVFAFLYGALFIRLFVFDDKRLGILIGIIALVFIASLFRIIWIFTIFPVYFLLIRNRKNTAKRFVLMTLGLVILLISVVAMYLYWISPYPEGIFYRLLQADLNIRLIGKIIIEQISMNLKKLFGLNTIVHKSEFIVRYIYLLVIVLFAVNFKKNPRIILSGLFVLISTLLTTILIYDIGNFRILAPFLYIVLLVTAFMTEKIFVKNVFIVYSVIGVIGYPLFLANFSDLHTLHFNETNISMSGQDETGLSQLKFKENADPWCNSLFTTRIFPPEFLRVPAGIGLNVSKYMEIPESGIKSHYLLVPDSFLNEHGIAPNCKTLQSFNNEQLCVRTNDACD